jgi:hypothetical protein
MRVASHDVGPRDAVAKMGAHLPPLAPHPAPGTFSLSAYIFRNFATFGATTYAQYGWPPLRSK